MSDTRGAVRDAALRLIWAALLAAAVVTGGAPAGADEVTLESIKDNTIYAENGALSNGAGDLFAGVTNRTNQIRRALLAFDVAGNIPAGSTVASAQLTLNLDKTISGPQAVTIHRLLADWGEGTSAGAGQGAPATPGDATWTHRFFDTTLWSSAGGDFVADPSATQDVGSSSGPYTWESTPQMVADVQGWLDAPGTNFGWLVRGNEMTAPTTKRFASREVNAVLAPKLVVQFTTSGPGIPTPTPTPELNASPSPTPHCIGDCDGSGTVKINEIIICVNIALDSQPASNCRACLPNEGDTVTVTEIIAAVNNVLNGC